MKLPLWGVMCLVCEGVALTLSERWATSSDPLTETVQGLNIQGGSAGFEAVADPYLGLYAVKGKGGAVSECLFTKSGSFDLDDSPSPVMTMFYKVDTAGSSQKQVLLSWEGNPVSLFYCRIYVVPRAGGYFTLGVEALVNGNTPKVKEVDMKDNNFHTGNVWNYLEMHVAGNSMVLKSMGKVIEVEVLPNFGSGGTLGLGCNYYAPHTELKGASAIHDVRLYEGPYPCAGGAYFYDNACYGLDAVCGSPAVIRAGYKMSDDVYFSTLDISERYLMGITRSSSEWSWDGGRAVGADKVWAGDAKHDMTGGNYYTHANAGTTAGVQPDSGMAQCAGYEYEVGPGLQSISCGGQMLCIVSTQGSPAPPATSAPVMYDATAEPTTAPDTPAPDTPAPDTPAPDTTAPDTPAPDTPAPDTVAPDTPAPDTPAPDTPAPDTMAPDTLAPDTPAPDTPAPDTTAPDTVAPDTPAPDTPAPDTPSPDTPAPDTPSPDTPAPDTPSPDTPSPDTPSPDTPAPDTPSPDTSAPDTPSPDTPSPDTPAPDTPAPDTPSPDTPAPDTPSPDTPAPDTPSPDTPSPDTPSPDTPAPDTPSPDTSAPDTPSPDTPSPDTPAPDTSAPDTPAPDTTAPMTTAPLTTAPVTIAPMTTAPLTTSPMTAAPLTTAPLTAAPVTAAPVTTAPVTAAPRTTAPLTTAPVTTSPLTTAPATTAPLTTAPLTTSPMTTAPLTTAPLTTAPLTAAPVTTAPLTTSPMTTAPLTTAPLTTAPLTVAPRTTAPLTTSPMTTAPLTMAPLTAAPVTTAPLTTSPVTTAPLITSPVTTVPVTTAPITTSPETLAPQTTAQPNAPATAVPPGETLVPTTTPNADVSSTPMTEPPPDGTPAPVSTQPPIQGAGNIEIAAQAEGASVPNSAAASGSTTAAAAVSTHAGTVKLLMHFECNVEDVDLSHVEPLDWEFHPLQFPVGDHQHKYFLGACIGNTLILAAFLVLNYLAALLQTSLFHIPLGKALYYARAPGLVYIPLVWLLTGTSMSASNMAFFPSRAPAGVALAGWTFLVACLSMPVLLWCFLRKGVFHATTVADPNLEDAVGTDETKPSMVLHGGKRWVYKFVYGTEVWVRSEGASLYFVERWGMFFESYRRGYHWWSILDVLQVLLVALFSAWKTDNYAACMVRNSLLTLGLLAYFGAVVFLRPFLAQCDQIAACILSGALFVAILMMTTAIGFNGAHASAATGMVNTAAVILIASAIFMIIKGGYDIILFIIDMYVGRRQAVLEASRTQKLNASWHSEEEGMELVTGEYCDSLEENTQTAKDSALLLSVHGQDSVPLPSLAHSQAMSQQSSERPEASLEASTVQTSLLDDPVYRARRTATSRTFFGRGTTGPSTLDTWAEEGDLDRSGKRGRYGKMRV